MARIDCKRCAHSVVLSGAIMEKMVGRLERIDNAEKRFRCSRCMGKGANISVIRPPSR